MIARFSMFLVLGCLSARSGATGDAGESCGFSSKWMSADVRTLRLVLAGGDEFCACKAEFVLPEKRGETRSTQRDLP